MKKLFVSLSFTLVGLVLICALAVIIGGIPHNASARSHAMPYSFTNKATIPGNGAMFAGDTRWRLTSTNCRPNNKMTVEVKQPGLLRLDPTIQKFQLAECGGTFTIRNLQGKYYLALLKPSDGYRVQGTSAFEALKRK